VEVGFWAGAARGITQRASRKRGGKPRSRRKISACKILPHASSLRHFGVTKGRVVRTMPVS